MKHSFSTLALVVALSAVATFPTAVVADTPATPSSPTVPAREEPPDDAHRDLEILEQDVRDLMRLARSESARKDRLVGFLRAVLPARELVSRRPDAASRELLLTATLGARLYEEAEKAAVDWIREEPPDWRAHFYLGQARNGLLLFEEAIGPLESAAVLAREEHSRPLVARSLGFSLEKLKRFEDALAVYEAAGESASAARVRENMESLAGTHTVLGGCVLWADNPEFEAMEEEARRLEEELRKLEEGDG